VFFLRFITFHLPTTRRSATRYVTCLKKGKKTDRDVQQKLSNAIAQQTGAANVGDLRRLSDQEWLKLDLPALCRILLKYCVRQAARPPAPHSSSSKPVGVGLSSPTPSADPFLEQLQNDFNYGAPFDMALFAGKLNQLEHMGFSQPDALEALCITENKTVEVALELLVDDKAARKKKRDDVVARLGRQAGQSQGQAQAQSNPFGGTLSPTAGSTGGDDNMRRQLDAERASRAKAETELKTQIAVLPRTLYKEYIRGMVADETISIADLQALKVYRESKSLSQGDHDQALKELNLTAAQFEGMKKLKSKSPGGGGESECVVCLDKPKDHVITPCMHLCLCEDCVATYSKKNAKCPLCSKRVVKIMRIFV